MAEGVKRDPHGLICALKAKKETCWASCLLSFTVWHPSRITMYQKKKKALSMSHADAAILLFSSPSPEWLLSKLTSVLEVPLPLVFSYNIRKQTKAQDNSTMNNGNHILLSEHNVHQGLEAWRCDLCLEVTSWEQSQPWQPWWIHSWSVHHLFTMFQSFRTFQSCCSVERGLTCSSRPPG